MFTLPLSRCLFYWASLSSSPLFPLRLSFLPLFRRRSLFFFSFSSKVSYSPYFPCCILLRRCLCPSTYPNRQYSLWTATGTQTVSYSGRLPLPPRTAADVSFVFCLSYPAISRDRVALCPVLVATRKHGRRRRHHHHQQNVRHRFHRIVPVRAGGELYFSHTLFLAAPFCPPINKKERRSAIYARDVHVAHIFFSSCFRALTLSCLRYGPLSHLWGVDSGNKKNKANKMQGRHEGAKTMPTSSPKRRSTRKATGEF